MKTVTRKTRSIETAAPPAANDDDAASAISSRHAQIATAAYYKAEARGFTPDLQVNDWLNAEAEYDSTHG